MITQEYICGVFKKWSSILRSIEGFSWPIYKGFYFMNEALDFARNHLGFDFYVEEAIEEDLKAANFILENQISGEEINRLTTQNTELTLQLSTKEIENENLKEHI